MADLYSCNSKKKDSQTGLGGLRVLGFWVLGVSGCRVSQFGGLGSQGLGFRGLHIRFRGAAVKELKLIN